MLCSFPGSYLLSFLFEFIQGDLCLSAHIAPVPVQKNVEGATKTSKQWAEKVVSPTQVDIPECVGACVRMSRSNSLFPNNMQRRGSQVLFRHARITSINLKMHLCDCLGPAVALGSRTATCSWNRSHWRSQGGGKTAQQTQAHELGPQEPIILSLLSEGPRWPRPWACMGIQTLAQTCCAETGNEAGTA